MISSLPVQFITNIKNVYKNRGVIWLQSLSNTLQTLCQAWDLRDLKPFPNLSYHFVARCLQKERSVVLKCGVPTPEFNQQLDALNFFHGSGTPKVLLYDTTLGAYLMESINPGISLKTAHFFDEDVCVKVASEVIKKLHAQKISSS